MNKVVDAWDEEYRREAEATLLELAAALVRAERAHEPDPGCWTNPALTILYRLANWGASHSRESFLAAVRDAGLDPEEALAGVERRVERYRLIRSMAQAS